MMKSFFLSIWFFTGAYVCTAQYADSLPVWTLGENVIIDFRGGVPRAVGGGNFKFREGSAMMTDRQGDLLFYTDGSFVWNRYHDTMQGTENLTGLPYLASEFGGGTPTFSASQGAVIVPVPQDSNRYYIFSQSAREGKEKYGNRLYYSVIDIRLDNGNGGVVPGLKGIFIDSGLCEAMIAIPGDECNIWLLVAGRNDMFAYDISVAGFNSTPVVSHHPRFPYQNNPVSGVPVITEIGMLHVASDRRKIALTTTENSGYASGLVLSDFDPATGRVSNMQVLSTEGYYGVCFSPNNLRLYASTCVFGLGKIHQYNLELPSFPDVIASRTVLGSAYNAALKKGPDNKIYFRRHFQADPANWWNIYPGSFLSCIPNPDAVGIAAGFTDTAIRFLPGMSMDIGLPSMTPFVFGKDTSRRHHEVQVCYDDKVEIAAGSRYGIRYEWNDGLTASSRLIRQAGTYTLRYRIPPCTEVYETYHVKFTAPLPEVIVAPACRGAADGMARIMPDSRDTGVYEYSWFDESGRPVRYQAGNKGDSLQGIAAGRYRLHLKTEGVCDTILRFTVPEWEYNLTPGPDQVVCFTDTVEVRNLSTGDWLAFRWDAGDGTISAARNLHHLYQASGSYQVILSGITVSGCRDTARINVRIDTTAHAFFTLSGDSVCVGEQMYMYPEVPQGANGYIWDPGDGTVPENPSVTGHIYRNEGGYRISLRVSNEVCPDTEHSDSVFVFPLPVVELGPDTSLCPGKESVLLNNKFPLAMAVRYTWNDESRMHSRYVNVPGTYILSAMSYHGCAAQDSVVVSRACLIDIPNVFSPDGDGINDRFFSLEKLSGKLSHIQIKIFNRWGQIIFHTSDVHSRGWDGTLNGVTQPNGVYIYQVEALLKDTRKQVFTGNVTLLR